MYNYNLLVMEIAKYFKDFLETDFKMQRMPKRHLNTGINSINLDNYPEFKELIFNNLIQGVKNKEIIIKKGQYKKQKDLKVGKIQKINDVIDENKLNNFIEEIIKYISQNSLSNEAVNEAVEDNNQNKGDKANNILEINNDILIQIDIIKSLFKKYIIYDSLHDLGLSEENYIEIINKIIDFMFNKSGYDIENELKEILFSFHKNKNYNLFKDSLSNIFKLEKIKELINNVLDENIYLFHEISNIFNERRQLDKMQTYFYFFNISYLNDKFPLFYMKFSLHEDKDSFKIRYDTMNLYLYTKGINFIIDKYNNKQEKIGTLRSDFERIIEIDDDIEEKISTVIKKIQNFFSLPSDDLIKNYEKKEISNTNGIKLSKNIYITLFEEGDEAIVNDYEEMITGNTSIIKSFSELIRTFIEENPKSYISSIEKEWEETTIYDKLIYESPVSLNEEQRKIINALDKKDCKFIIVEGPPGTGKSHTIVAIACKAILSGKSILIISDKKEALDVVEDKIIDTINKVRHDKEFQNPILRLGKKENKFNKILRNKSNIIQKLSEFDKLQRQYEDENKDIIIKIKSELDENITYYKNIPMEDIEYYFINYNKFYNLKLINILDDYEYLKYKDDIITLKEYMNGIRKIIQDNGINIDLDNISDEKLNYYTNLRDYLEQIKQQKYRIKSLEKIKDHLLLFFKEDTNLINNLENDLIMINNFIKYILGIRNMNILFKEYNKYNYKYNNTQYLLSSFIEDIKNLEINYNISQKIIDYIGNNDNKIKIISNFIPDSDLKPSEIIELLNIYIEKVKQILDNPIYNILFWLKKDKIVNLNIEYKKFFPKLDDKETYKKVSKLLEIKSIFEIIINNLSKNRIVDTFDIISIIMILSIDIKKHELDKFFNMVYKIEDKYKMYCNIIDLLDNDYLEGIKLIRLIKTNNMSTKYSLFDILNNLQNSIDRINKLISVIKLLLSSKEKINYIINFHINHPDISDKIKLNIDKLESELDNYNKETIEEYFVFKNKEYKISNFFNKMPSDTYKENIEKLQDITTSKMTNIIDKEFIKYCENNANDINTLKNIISKGKKIHSNFFFNFKKAFPCIIAGIREYSNYIPLEKDIFDIIIIDEASQVSIAQALPAFVRGKQIIIFGDEKQFSNVKSSYASIDINNEYKSKIKDALKTYIPKDREYLLDKIMDNFDIKNSVLKFVKFVRNYEIQLRKHFRGYPELISYSNKYFYNNTLQCMKIRGENIHNVIKFEFIKHDGLLETSNINKKEAEYIIEKLKEYKNQGFTKSIGIITPYKEQAKYLYELIDKLEEREYFYKNFDLKIMTFDACQGEERDYIFYSMVATEESDTLSHIFPVDLSKLDIENEGTLRAQRLNVGFSRAKETIHFVLSKPISEFRGEIQKALFHFWNELQNGDNKKIGGTDPMSPMEEKIQNYFFQTNFYKENKGNIAFFTQFPIGEYLKQLDTTYNHPKYKVDFLIIFDNQKIVIEYDGFEEHFNNLANVNKYNYKYYMKEEDIYRQKVLESYGCKFIRINKFNIGKNPIKELDKRLNEIINIR